MQDDRKVISFGNKKFSMKFKEASGIIRHTLNPYTADKILKELFDEDYEKSIRYFIQNNPISVADAIDEKEAEDFELKSIGLPKYLSSWTQNRSQTFVDVEIIANIEATVPATSLRPTGLYIVQKTRKEFPLPFRIRYYLDLKGKRCALPVIAPAQFFPENEIADCYDADEYLLPKMDQTFFSKAARKMLEMYYPEALKEPTAVDGRILAKRMKVEIRPVWYFIKGSDIMGKTYFVKDWITCDMGEGGIGAYEIYPMTILINMILCEKPEVFNSTIIHECCHIFLDMLFFSLQKLAGEPFRTHVCRKKESRCFNTDNPIERMEWQAEMLPAYVLMEEENTRKEIERFMSKQGEVRSPERMRRLVERLAEIYKVPVSMAKDRMIELGYPEAEGVVTEINGSQIPDHGCGGPWRPEITYTISREDAARMLIEDPEFSRAVCSGLYTYAEGHFCLDDWAYIHRDRKNGKRLSAYARRHMEECCLAFTKLSQSMKVTYLKGQAEKHTPEAGILQTRHVLESEPDSKDRINQNKQFYGDALLWAEVKRTIPDNIKSAVFDLMHRKGLSQEEIGMRLGVSRPAFAGWFKKNISLRHVVAICIAMDVRVDISLEFVRLAGYSFMNSEEHQLLLSFLFETDVLNVARANEMLREKGMKPLTEGHSEELAEVS